MHVICRIGALSLGLLIAVGCKNPDASDLATDKPGNAPAYNGAVDPDFGRFVAELTARNPMPGAGAQWQQRSILGGCVVIPTGYDQQGNPVAFDVVKGDPRNGGEKIATILEPRGKVTRKSMRFDPAGLRDRFTYSLDSAIGAVTIEMDYYVHNGALRAITFSHDPGLFSFEKSLVCE